MLRVPGTIQGWRVSPLSCMYIARVVCHKARVPYDTRAVSYHTLGVTYGTLLETKASACQTKPTVTVFVLPIKFAHIRDIVTRKACRVMTRVPVSSPFYLKSCGGSHFVLGHCKICWAATNSFQ